MSDKTSLAKRLIKDLVLPKANEVDENCQDKSLKSDTVSDGYVIVSFYNRKKAQIQTATFSDVSKHSSDTMNILKSHNGYDESNNTSNIPDEDNFYGEAFWIGSEDEEEMEDNLKPTPPISGTAESDRSSQKDDSDSIGSQPRPKMTRLTALSKGLLNTETNGLKKSVNKLKGGYNSSGNVTGGGPGFIGDSRAVYYGGTEDGRKMLRCRECGKHYRNDYSLRHHICLRRKEVWKKGDVPKELVDGQVIYFCPTCAKPFRWMGNLTRHFYVHTGQRFFKCDVCDKEFFSAYQVRRHMNSHTGMRYKCRVCEKPFTCVYACTWHMRQHTLEHQQQSLQLPPPQQQPLTIPLTLAGPTLPPAVKTNSSHNTTTAAATESSAAEIQTSSLSSSSSAASSSDVISPNSINAHILPLNLTVSKSSETNSIIAQNQISDATSTISNVLNLPVPSKDIKSTDRPFKLELQTCTESEFRSDHDPPSLQSTKTSAT